MLKKIKNTVKRILTCSIPGTKHSFLFPYCFIILFLLLFPFNISKYDFIVQYGNDVSTSTQLCYNTGNGWNEANSLTEETSDNAVSFSIDNSINSSVLQYRLDPTPLETDMVIDYIAIEFKNHIIKIPNFFIFLTGE